jgi:hypothetical protein
MSWIEQLTELTPPPAVPHGATGDWDAVESELGLALPADFKAAIELYGAGYFAEFITLLTPFGPDLLRPLARRLLTDEQSFRAAHPDRCPYPFYPEFGGLLPWAGTDNGDRLCWLTAGEPDTWTTVAWNPRGWYYEAFDMGAVEFLCGWLTGRVSTTVFPDAREFADEDED